MSKFSQLGLPTMEFHVARSVRDQFAFDESIFESDGNVVFADFEAARRFAEKLNTARPIEKRLRPGQLNAMGLIDEILHLVVAQYREQVKPTVMRDASSVLRLALGDTETDKLLRTFCEQFPPVSVYTQETKLSDYLANPINQDNALEEMVMLWVANDNPAFMKTCGELFDDTALAQTTTYTSAMQTLQTFFAQQPTFSGESLPLLELLREPARKNPDSLEAQLDFIAERFERVSGLSLVIRRMSTRLLIGRDVAREEQRQLTFGTGFVDFTPAKGTIHVIDYKAEAAALNLPEYEAFTQDKEWMPRCVLIAKTTYVWLDQLSKKYGREISRLDQIPDEELDFLRDAGVTGLWLIGLWERSIASRRMKQMMGQDDAVASAYSLMDYAIAGDLGGHDAVENLKGRAWQRGIRLASDMVPNHMGIDSNWVVNRPDYFLALDYPPYPSYTFNGTDLSNDPRVGVYLEDHYYDHSDASVVFKRVDKWTGDTKYIYHGNDGTSFPWNDTAQLNYLNPDVREAVIQTIFHMARQFPIIRFDAAMTLAKKHVKRLWFPQPGAGDGIPSRAAFGMTVEQFDALMPNEFWREVVDRAAVEIPDTLLMAEAFWLMEGYFVRTLGMHRVYNSAFMHMMRDEDNAKYRQLIKNTIEFDSEILKRYVNFQTNHDERPAKDQFATGDKYFGVCVLMSTLPGMPMFGHGQFEGFGERYGVEYRRPKLNEVPDGWLIDRHRREIFPLLHKRYVFSGVENFLLYDFYEGGGVNEDVIAYSNSAGEDRGLVIYHNRYATARGWIKISAASLNKSNNQLEQKTLGDGLGLHNDPRHFTILRDQLTGLEFIRNSRELCEQGMYVELEAYKCHAFVGIREVFDADGHYAQVASQLSGRGVPSMDEALTELRFGGVHQAFRALVNKDLFEALTDAVVDSPASVSDEATGLVDDDSEDVAIDLYAEADEKAEAKANEIELTTTVDAALLDGIEQKVVALLEAAKAQTNGSEDVKSAAKVIRDEVESILRLPTFTAALTPRQQTGNPSPTGEGSQSPTQLRLKRALNYFDQQITDNPDVWHSLLGWACVHRLGYARLDEWLLGKLTTEAYRHLGRDEWNAGQLMQLTKVLVNADSATADKLLDTAEARSYLQVNAHEGVRYFNKEAFEQLVSRLFLVDLVRGGDGQTAEARQKTLLAAFYRAENLLRAMESSGYEFEKLSAGIKSL